MVKAYPINYIGFETINSQQLCNYLQRGKLSTSEVESLILWTKGNSMGSEPKFNKNMTSLKYELKDSIATNDLKYTFELLRGAIEKDSARYNELILLEGRYLELVTNIKQNTMPIDFIQIEMNRIRASLMHLVDKIGDINIDRKKNVVQTIGDPSEKLITVDLSLWEKIMIFFKNLF